VELEILNRALADGAIDRDGLFPHLDRLQDTPFVFETHFGLDELPTEPGLLLVRGARQFGKSTWLERELRNTIRTFGPGTAFYLNGDHLRDADGLTREVQRLVAAFRTDAPVRRLFIDEITSLPDWTRGLKRLLDGGELRRVLVVTTGSRATDLHRGAERLPGRRGKLDRTTFHFTPVSFREFRRVCGKVLGEETLDAYLISGGSPLACGELAAKGRLPEWVVDTTRDWILGECVASGRSRSSLLGVMNVLLRHGASPLGQSKLARDAGLANNTVALGYLDLLGDLMCVGTTRAWDESRRVVNARRPAKAPMVNLLAAVAWHSERIRTVDDFRRMPPSEQGVWIEWLVAQELTRRRALRGEELPHELLYWDGGGHEIDFVEPPSAFIEVKRGAANPLEFSWFHASHPKAQLLVVCASKFRTDHVRGATLAEFLLEH